MCSADRRVSMGLRITFTTTMRTAHLPMYPKRLVWMTHTIALDLLRCGQTSTTTGVLTFLLQMMDSPTIFTATTATDTLPTLRIWRAWPLTRMEPSKPTWGLLSAITSTTDSSLSRLRISTMNTRHYSGMTGRWVFPMFLTLQA